MDTLGKIPCLVESYGGYNPAHCDNFIWHNLASISYDIFSYSKSLLWQFFDIDVD